MNEIEEITINVIHGTSIFAILSRIPFTRSANSYFRNNRHKRCNGISRCHVSHAFIESHNNFEMSISRIRCICRPGFRFLRLDGLFNHARSTKQPTNSGPINPSLNRRNRTFHCGCRFCRIGYQDDATLYSESA